MVLSMSVEAAEVDVAGLAVPPPRLDGLEPVPAVGAGGDIPAPPPPPSLPAERQNRDREKHDEQEQLGTHLRSSSPSPPAAVNKNASSHVILGAVFFPANSFRDGGHRRGDLHHAEHAERWRPQSPEGAAGVGPQGEAGAGADGREGPG